MKAKKSFVEKWGKKCDLGRIHFDCYYCGVKLVIDAKAKGETPLTIDHLEPKARGGTNDIENLVPACQRCNVAKGQLLPFEFVGLVTELKNLRNRYGNINPSIIKYINE